MTPSDKPEETPEERDIIEGIGTLEQVARSPYPAAQVVFHREEARALLKLIATLKADARPNKKARHFA